MSRRSVAALLTAGAAGRPGRLHQHRSAGRARPAGGASGAAAARRPDHGAGGRHRLRGQRRRGPRRHDHVQHHQRRQQGHRVLPLRQGDRIMGEVENIGPGLTRQLIVEVPDGGTYTTACKPGMVGDGIRAPFTVTGAAAAARSTRTPSSPRPPPATSATRPRRSRRWSPKTRSSSTRSRPATSSRPRRCSRSRAPTGSGSSPSRSRSATSTPRSTAATTASPASSSPATTASRRTCGQDGLQPDSDQIADQLHGRHQGPADARGHGRADPACSWPTAPRSCSTRSPPARSPARRTATRTPTCGTSRPTSRARRPRSPRCAR